ncbi:SsgA family sporulation/cell division regulator [Saccharopolyspora phatthalungensis]|uniref:Sporulation and cell division protein SsgA n=1 Tax=Saccharopolyspora phatthalungensis TaxID=664693 RepID=A0A840Q9G4_9PSEU|nr:SsgA family sporulation/cell division regulator [Saccharopolyspora phatthalungensis]MBB5159182.1 hypothetical protein [Saccharopolyspora phatthalungensis]
MKLNDQMCFSMVVSAGVFARIGVELRYNRNNPYEVSLAFNTGKSVRVNWVIGRDLLADGLLAESGLGDVRIRPRPDAPGTIEISLNPPTGQATFEADAAQLMEFLNNTYDIVAPGEEHRWMDIDDTLSRLLTQDS